MKYKVGDRVRIVQNWNKTDISRVNPRGKMDRWLGKTMTIKETRAGYYKMVEDTQENFGKGWGWFEDMVEGFVTLCIKTDLKTGDVVQCRNGEIGIVIVDMNVIIFSRGHLTMSQLDSYLIHLFNNAFDVVAIRRPNCELACDFNAFELKLGTLIYERNEPEEMTLTEVCKLLGKEIKIIK